MSSRSVPKNSQIQKNTRPQPGGGVLLALRLPEDDYFYDAPNRISLLAEVS